MTNCHTKPRVVIVGAGQAGFQVAASLRQSGFAGSISIFGDEPHLPYQRPPLSKDFLLKKLTTDRLALRLDVFFDERDITVTRSVSIARIEPKTSRVITENGDSIDYDYLILATGSSNRRLPFSSSIQDGVFSLRNIADAQQIASRLADAQHVSVIGAGYVGLEVASAASQLGKTVTVIEAANQVMSRTASPELATFVTDLHRRSGTEIRTDAGVSGYLATSDGDVKAVCLNTGEQIQTDLVIEGVGAAANSVLAETAGIECDRGVIVDFDLKTNHDRIYAVGDAAVFQSRRYGQRLRLESVHNAIEQGRHVAAVIMAHAANTNSPPAYDPVPWFWTDQHSTKIQTVGVGIGADNIVIRGSMNLGQDSETKPSFSLFAFRGDDLLAVDSINRTGDHMACRRLLESGRSPTPSQAGDSDFELKSLIG